MNGSTNVSNNVIYGFYYQHGVKFIFNPIQFLPFQSTQDQIWPVEMIIQAGLYFILYIYYLSTNPGQKQMATIAKRASAVHPHCRRRRNSSKHENSPPKAHAEKPPSQTPKQKITRSAPKARINRKQYEGSAKRTMVSKYLAQLTNWQRNFRNDKFFRYRVISRRYLRKLSLHQDHQDRSSQRRKISWGDQVEILIFDSQQNPRDIAARYVFKESLNTSIL